MPAVHVALQGISKRFPASAGGQEVHALGPIDLAIRQGEFFAVVGPSGCGKSTLLELIAGLVPATEGRIEFEGRPIEADVPDGIGVVFQEDACFPWLSVRDNVAFGLRKAALGAEEKARRGRILRCECQICTEGPRRSGRESNNPRRSSGNRRSP